MGVHANVDTGWQPKSDGHSGYHPESEAEADLVAEVRDWRSSAVKGICEESPFLSPAGMFCHPDFSSPGGNGNGCLFVGSEIRRAYSSGEPSRGPGVYVQSAG